MKILHINTYDKGGGAETVVMQLLNYHTESYLLTKTAQYKDKQIQEFPKNKKDRFFHLIDQILWKLGIRKKFKRIFFLEDEWNDTYYKLKSNSAYKEADIIHLHNLHGGYFDLKALKNIAKEKKIVWTLHDMWCMTGGEAHTFNNENYKKGIAYTPFVHQYPLRNSVIDRRQYFLELKKRVYTDIAPQITFVPVSNWLNTCFHESYVFNQQLKTNVIYNGVDTDIFFQHQEKNWTNPRLLIFNSNNPFKGGEIFEQILPFLPENIEITIIGEKLPFILKQSHNYRPYIKDRKELSACYNQHDILIFPSKAEALGLVPMEAMACGVCVFASNVGGIPEIIDSGNTGFLFNNHIDLLHSLQEKMQDVHYIRSIGKKASEKIRTHFSLQKMREKYDQLYRSISDTK